MHHLGESQPSIGAFVEFLFPVQDDHEGDDILHHGFPLQQMYICGID